MTSVDQTVPPSVTITPASPTGTATSTLATPIQPKTTTIPTPGIIPDMKEKTATDSDTALLSQQQQSSTHPSTSTEKASTGRTSPMDILTRKLSGKGSSKPEVSKSQVEGSHSVKQETNTSSSNPQTAHAPATASSTSRSPPTASTSTSKPSQIPNNVSRTAPKKKKKRKGLAGLFVALGCLSAGDIDDDEPKHNVRRDMAQKPTTQPVVATAKPTTAPTTTTTTTAPTPVTPTTKEPETTQNATSTAETTLVDGPSKTPIGASTTQPEDVVVAPIEPAHIPVDETAGMTSAAVQPPGSGSELLSTPQRPHAIHRESEASTRGQGDTSGSGDTSKDKTESSGGYTDISDSDVRTGDENMVPVGDEIQYQEEEYEDEEDRLIAQGGKGIPLDENGQPMPLLPPMDKAHHGRKCLVLDLDETLLHSSFKMLPSADYIVPVEIESQVHNVYVIKRPGVDHFLTEMGKIYEVVIFTASLSKYADPVLDMLDPQGVVRHRLFRESCYNHKGNYVKDLSQLGRDMEGCIILDNSPASYIFHPNNAVPVSTWFNDPHDTELTDLCPFLVDLATVEDVRGVLDGSL